MERRAASECRSERVSRSEQPVGTERAGHISVVVSPVAPPVRDDRDCDHRRLRVLYRVRTPCHSNPHGSACGAQRLRRRGVSYGTFVSVYPVHADRAPSKRNNCQITPSLHVSKRRRSPRSSARFVPACFCVLCEGTQHLMHNQSSHFQVQRVQSSSQPVLIGTTSVEDSENIVSALSEVGINAAVLNARPENAALEGRLVAQAGRLGQVTVATNMAGRGTDIRLGGNAAEFTKVRDMKHA